MSNSISDTFKQRKIYELSHDWFIENFHKLSESNKIKAALPIILKYIPVKIEGQTGNGTVINVIASPKGNIVNARHPIETVPE